MSVLREEVELAAGNLCLDVVLTVLFCTIKLSGIQLGCGERKVQFTTSYGLTIGTC